MYLSNMNGISLSADTIENTELSPVDSEFPITPADASSRQADTSIRHRIQSQNSECSTSSYEHSLESAKSLIEVMRNEDDHIDPEEEERVWRSFEGNSVSSTSIPKQMISD